MSLGRSFAACLLLAALAAGSRAPASIGGAARPEPLVGAQGWTVDAGPPLSEPLANNAVASSIAGGRDRLFTFMGLGAGRDFRAITSRAYSLDTGVKGAKWQRLADVPGGKGRIAATAQSVGDRIYIFGGYEVAADAKETTHREVDIYDVAKGTYARGADTPVPIDDTVSGVWRSRLIFLVSGWSVADNVAAVQIYDPAVDRWTTATPIPGTPVFGHAGSIMGDVIVYCGGARVQAPKTPKYAASRECYRGDIDPERPANIAWRLIAHHPGPARYRAAAGPVHRDGLVGVMFAGGTANPYNYNGVGYDGKPSEPEDSSWIYDIRRDVWVEGPSLGRGSMDHRGLAVLSGSWWIIGGLGPGQAVSAGVTRIGAQR